MINNNCENLGRLKINCLGHNKVNVHQYDYDKIYINNLTRIQARVIQILEYSQCLMKAS